MLDTVLLSRIQFGFTIGFHIIFPTLNIGLALFLCVAEGAWLKTKNNVYLRIAKFWTKIFALTFGMGVVSGVVLAYELGTNFSKFTLAVGGVLGPLLGYEVLSAFFLEAGFLGVMLFGWSKVTPRMHYFSTVLVTLGTLLSAFWIMSANSWMQTPAGYEIVAGKYIVTSWLEAIFNPSFLLRFFHMTLASFVTSSFVVAAVSAWYLIKNRHVPMARICFSIAMWGALIFTPTQVLVGDLVGVKIFEHQPIKTAAMEGLWETTKGAPLVLFGMPDAAAEKNHFELSIPYLASLLNTHEIKGEMPGLKSVPKSERPLVKTVFYSFRIMLAIGFLFLGMVFYAAWLRMRKKLFQPTWFHKLCVLSAPLGFVATIFGWIASETGRQPWLVYGKMKTAAGASVLLQAEVMTSLILFIVVYGVVFWFYLYYLFKVIRKGPTAKVDIDEPEDHMFQYMSGESP